VDLTRIETERLLIRDHLARDLADMQDLLSRELEMHYLPELTAATAAEAKANLEQARIQQAKADRTLFFFAILEKSSGGYVGEIGFSCEEPTPLGCLAHLGYFTKHEYWNQGYITEAGRAVLRFGFESCRVWKFKTGCLAENRISERVMQKLGFRKEAEFRKHQFHIDSFKDRLEYGLLREDWANQ
jgi:ribosomal-protein-alanine N-acetyltransferase